MKIKFRFLVILVFFVSINIFAQEDGNQKNRAAQVTFLYPLGSGGMNSTEYTNNFSLNILYGLNGGVNGAEIGSILNYNKGNVSGFQLSGVININHGQSNGFLLSGVTTINQGQSKGFLLSGVANINQGQSKGFLLSGVLNSSSDNAQGFFLSPVNIAKKDFTGFQLGVVNFASKLNGVQLGVLNIANDASKGIPVGLVNIVKNGYYELEAMGGEVIYSNLNFKMGVERFYTIYKLGYSNYKNNPVYSLGLGIGSKISISDNHSLNIDLSANQIVYDNNWDCGSNSNSLSKADFNYKYSVTNKFSLLIGPSFNVYSTKEKVDGEFGTLNIPYSIYEDESENRKLQMWFGLNAGLALRL